MATSDEEFMTRLRATFKVEAEEHLHEPSPRRCWIWRNHRRRRC